MWIWRKSNKSFKGFKRSLWNLVKIWQGVVNIWISDWTWLVKAKHCQVLSPNFFFQFNVKLIQRKIVFSVALLNVRRNSNFFALSNLDKIPPKPFKIQHRSSFGLSGFKNGLFLGTWSTLCEKHIQIKIWVVLGFGWDFGLEWIALVWLILVWFGLDWIALVWLILVFAWFGLAWFGLDCFGLVWHDLVWHDLVWFGLVWFGLDWFGLVWFGLLWFSLGYFDLIWLGWVFVDYSVSYNLLLMCTLYT